MPTYMLVLAISVFFPLVFSFYPPLKFWRNSRALALTIILLVVIFGSWDMFAVWRGHWYFNPRGIYGFKIINLPVEEWLFFVIIPFCCIFTWEAIRFIMKKSK